MKGAAREQTADTCITDVYRDWVLGSALWYYGYSVPEFLSQGMQTKLTEEGSERMGCSHQFFPKSAKVETVFNPVRGIVRGPNGKDRVEDEMALRVRSYLCPSFAGHARTYPTHVFNLNVSLNSVTTKLPVCISEVSTSWGKSSFCCTQRISTSFSA